MKKFLASLLIALISLNIFGFSSTYASSSEKNTHVKNLIISKYNLEETTKGSEYLVAVDAFIEENKDNQVKLEKLNSRLELLLNSGDLDDINNDVVIELIDYMYAKTSIALMNIESTEVVIEKESLVDQLDDTINETNKEEEIVNNLEELTDLEKEFIESKIVTLQLNLLEKSENILENLTEEFEDISSYKETGDFDFNLSMNFLDEMSFESKLSISDYESITDVFDSKFKGDINGIFEANYGEESIDLQVNTFIDFITMDGNSYLLLKDFEVIKKQGVETIESYLDTLTEISEKNEYIAFEDEEAYNTIQMLKNLNPSKIISDGEVILSEPMFEGYKKDDEKYYIKPTKYACDLFKSSLNKFDPFYGADCSNSQYEDMIEELEESGEFYITFDDDISTIGFESNDIYNIYDSNSGYISFNENEVKEIYYAAIPNQEEYPDEIFEIDYKDEDSLNIKLYANSGMYDIDFNSTLDNSNNFETIDLDLLFGDFSADFALNNRYIDGSFELLVKDFDYTTYEYVESSNISGTISGKTDYNNDLEDLEVIYKGTTIDEEEYLDGSFILNEYKFNFINNYISDSFTSSIDIEGQFDDETFISDLESNIEIKNKQASFNYDTWEYEYSDDFNQIFLSEISIDDKEIKGNTSFEIINEFSLEIEHEGNYSDDDFKIENSISITSEQLVDYNGTINGRLEFNTDYESKNNDYYLLFELTSGEDEIINLEIENNGKKYNYDDYEFVIPTNTVDYEDVFETNNYYNYY